ncbi:metal-dependent hydrolase [Kaarinaea lacus]
MDSLTQLALGAAVGEATIGRKVGNRALLWGAVCGTIPDLDVFIPFGDAVADFTYHRAASHSLFVLALLSPLVVWLILKLHPDTKNHRQRWLLLVYLVFVTHVLLDCFTVYGTQIFWPFVTTPVGWSTIFIIDPLYTVWLLIGVIYALVATRENNRGHIINNLGIGLSSLYLAWTVTAKLYVNNITQQSLAQQKINYTQVITIPSPLNTVLWRVLAMDENGYYEGYFSLIDGHPEVTTKFYSSANHLLEGLEDHWPVQRLRWFTKGFYGVQLQAKNIVIKDLRMGVEPNYVFQFKVGEISNPHPFGTNSRRIESRQRMERLTDIWQRIWNHNHIL